MKNSKEAGAEGGREKATGEVGGVAGALLGMNSFQINWDLSSHH